MANVRYTRADLAAAALHAAAVSSPAADFPTGNAVNDLINDAVQFLVSEHDWSWLYRPLVLNFTEVFSTSALRLDNQVVVNTVSSGTLVTGDFLRIKDSLDADGEYYVADADNISFTVNQTAANGTVDPAGSWIKGWVDLPGDFSGIRNLERNSQIRTVYPTSMDRITRYRTSGGIYFTGPTGFYYCIRNVPQSDVDQSPVKRLELYPTPTAAEAAALVGEYRREIPSLGTDESYPDIGSDGMLHTLLRILVRAMAVSSEEDRAGEDWRRYERMLPKVIERDGDEQTNLGMIEGGVDDAAFGVDHLYPTRISPA